MVTRCLHQAGTWCALQGLQLQRLKMAWGKPWRIIAGAHRPPSPGQRWKSNEAVQRLFSEGCQASTVVCAGHAAVGAAATWRSAVVEDIECMYQLLAPRLDALGSPRETPARWEEFMKSWPEEWQSMITLFAEKRMGLGDSAVRGLPRSSGGEFLCPECGNDFPTLRRLKCHRGKAHGLRRPAARFVRDGVRPHYRIDLHGTAKAMAHLERGARSCREALMEGQLAELTKEELREADHELVRYRRQARVEGAYPDVGLLAVSV